MLLSDRMGAERIILTHFSQRYPKVPVFEACYTEQTCIAFDLMSVPFNRLVMLPRLTPAFQYLFPAAANEPEQGAENYSSDEDMD